MLSSGAMTSPKKHRCVAQFQISTVRLIIVSMVLSTLSSFCINAAESVPHTKGEADNTRYYELGLEMSKLSRQHDWNSPRYKELIDEFVQIRTDIQTDILNSEAHFNSARFSQGAGNEDSEAIKQFSICVLLNPKDVAALNNRAISKLKLGDKQGALRDLVRAIKLEPSNSALLENKVLIKSAPNQTETRKENTAPDFERKNRSASKDSRLFTICSKLKAMPFRPISNPRIESDAERTEKYLSLLTIAEQFADGVSGLTIPAGAKSESFLAFEHIAKAPQTVSIAQFESYLKKSTPAGKLYIAALIRKFDPQRAELVLKALTNDATPVEYRDGCCVEPLTVGVIAKYLMNPKGVERLVGGLNFWDIDDFRNVIEPTRKIERLKMRSQAQEFSSLRFSRVQIDHLGDSRLINKMMLPSEFLGGVPLQALQKELRTATPAGKLYIAAIMQKYYTPFGEVALNKLVSDKTMILCKTGPSPRDVPVSQIAKSLLETGQFETFSLEP